MHLQKQILRLNIKYEAVMGLQLLTDFLFYSKQKTHLQERTVWFKIRTPLVLSQMHSEH